MKKITTEEFILKSKSIHGNRYDYSKSEYNGMKNKVSITCRVHGEFKQQARSHIDQKAGCLKCARITQGRVHKKKLLSKKFKGLIQPKDYKLIPLTKEKFAKVDNEDFELLSKYNWSITAVHYCENSEKGRMHRFIMNAPKDMYVDHINHDPLDNRKSNLRICTVAENTQNQRARIGKKSKYKGVTWSKAAKKWTSSIEVDKKSYHLGVFIDEIEAAKAYDEAAKKYHKGFAYTNF